MPEVGSVREVLRRVPDRTDAVLVDTVLGAALAVALLVTAAAGTGPAGAADPRPVGALAVALAAVLAGAVAVRRRHPVAALVVLDAVCLAWFLAALPGRLVALAPLVGCYTLAARRGRWWGLAGAALTALVQIVAVRVVLGDTTTAGVVPFAVLLAATAASAGAAAGYHRALLAATRAELARETRTREERARLLAAQERLRIARELHDVLGHTLATISVQAGVGLHVLDRRPGQAREALAAIRTVSDDGLTDVKTILGILRSDAAAPDGSAMDAAVPAGPRGGLDRLPELAEGAQAAGLRVELDVDAGPPLPAPVDLAAYRIVQEALTNVLRHAGARAVRVGLARDGSWLRIRVRDDGTGLLPGADAGGHGLDGMRERARALGGRFTAAPHPGGGSEVRADLPVPDLPVPDPPVPAGER